MKFYVKKNGTWYPMPAHLVETANNLFDIEAKKLGFLVACDLGLSGYTFEAAGREFRVMTDDAIA